MEGRVNIMEIYLSSETEGRADSLLLPIRNIVDSLLDDIRKNEYGSALTSVGVFAIIMKEEMYDSGGYCERQYYSKVRKEADIRLRLNYKSFCNAEPEKRVELYKQHGGKNMGEMTKNQKREALRAWKQKEKKSYCLEQEEVEELFEYLEEALQAEECDHSLKNTEQWILDNIDDEERRDQVRREIKEDGGYCDCEVLGNCYEEYDI